MVLGVGSRSREGALRGVFPPLLTCGLSVMTRHWRGHFIAINRVISAGVMGRTCQLGDQRVWALEPWSIIVIVATPGSSATRAWVLPIYRRCTVGYHCWLDESSREKTR
jgi:hypothetical protein